MSPGRPAASVAATAPTSLAAAEAMTAMIQATIREAITPLVAVNERQAESIEALARENGRLTAELERAASTVVALGDEIAAHNAPGPSTAARTEAQDAKALKGGSCSRPGGAS